MSKKSVVITLRVPESMADKIARAVKQSGRDQADILRDAVRLGMSDMELIGYDPLDVAREKIQMMKDAQDPPVLASLPDVEAPRGKKVR